MKNILFLLFAAILLFGCEKNVIGGFGDQTLTPQEPVPVVLNKKGAAWSYNAKAWSHKIHDVGAHWFYHWGNTPREEIPDNVEYVPMFWGKSSVTDEAIARMIELKNEGRINYILGFNEPDGAQQANMTVDEAIALWPRLMEIGVPLVSPAPVGIENPWLIEFMEKAEAQNLRVDYIAVHSYGGSNPLAFIDKLKRVHERWNKPIWITEFAVADWNATSAADNRHSVDDVLNFMKEVLPALVEIEWIHKFAWFDGGVNRPQLASSALTDEEGNLTEVGRFYAEHLPNDLIGPGMDTEYIPPVDEDELLINGGFETNDIAPWGGFKNGVVGIETTPAHTGNYCGRIQNGDGSFFYIIDAESGKTYQLNFWSKWLTDPPSSFTAIIKNETEGSAKEKLFTLDPMPTTTDWEESAFEFTVPVDVDKIKMVFYKTNGFPPFFLDDVSLKEKK
jgi:hypothetical protein